MSPRRLRLLPERPELAPELRQHVLHAEQILVEAGELARGTLLAPAVLGDPRGLLDVLAALFGLGKQDLLQLALAHHGVQGAADAGLAQQLLNVEQADDLPVDPVLGFATAKDRPADLDLAHGHRDPARAVVDHDLDLGHAECRPRRRPGEDHVGHVPTPERARALLAQSPADRVDQVRLAGSVRADHHRDAGGELENGLVRERLEAADRDRAEEHRPRC